MSAENISEIETLQQAQAEPAQPHPKTDARGVVAFLDTTFTKSLFSVLLILYFLFLVVARAPASIAAWAAHKAVPALWLTSVSGTLWQGVAGGAQIDLADQPMALGEVRWRLDPWSLLLLNPCVNFETHIPGQMISGELCQSLAGVSKVNQLSLEAPVTLINPILPFDAAGQFSLDVISAEFDRKQVSQFNARISWQNARIKPDDNWIGLGFFAATANEDGNGGIAAEIFDLDSSFTLALKAHWQPGDENWSMGGTITPKSNAPQLIVQGLQSFGEEVEAGTYKVQWP
ncbi:MAG: general secretion pathway protein N [Lentisphaeria bacterium]|jgi:general secretion pathway protein N